MKIELTQRNINRDAYDSTRAFIRELADRHLEPHLRSFKASERRLHVTVEHEKLDYRAVMRLHIPPKKILIAHASDENIRVALQKAIEELSRQADRHQAQISGRQAWKRKQRHSKLKQLQSAVSDLQIAPVPTETTLAMLIPRIESWLRQEMTYLRATGDLQETYPHIAEVRDEVYLELQARWDKLDHDEQTLYPEMLKQAHQILEREIASNKVHENDLSLESSAPEDAMDQAEDMVEEEFEEFFQPDEILHIEDLLPTPATGDTELTEEEQAISTSYRLMAFMPIHWRRILLLTYRESLSPRQIADSILSTDVTTVERMLKHAEDFLLTHLQEHGLEEHSDLARLLKAS